MLLNKIVIAEDDDHIAHLMTAVLGDAGFLCLRARDGEQALALARAHLPDALVLDVMMPKASGLDVVRRLKADPIASRVPVLMTTSLGEVEDKVDGFAAGADDYLPKPFDSRELLARLQALIRHSRRERDRNSMTDLPGEEALEAELGKRLAARTSFAVAYLEVEGLKDLIEQAGFKEAEQVLRRAGEVALDIVRGRAFLAHLGLGDLVVVAQGDQVGELAREIVAAFGQRSAGGAVETCIRATVVGADGCVSLEQLAVRIAKSREPHLV